MKKLFRFWAASALLSESISSTKSLRHSENSVFSTSKNRKQRRKKRLENKARAMHYRKNKS